MPERARETREMLDTKVQHLAEESVEQPGVFRFVSTLDLLVDLRDKGNISREGFEQRIRLFSGSVHRRVLGNTDVVRQSSERRGAPGVWEKSEILAVLARGASHGGFDGAGALAEAAIEVGASTEEIDGALGLTQFTIAAEKLRRSRTAQLESAIATPSA